MSPRQRKSDTTQDRDSREKKILSLGAVYFIAALIVGILQVNRFNFYIYSLVLDILSVGCIILSFTT